MNNLSTGAIIGIVIAVVIIISIILITTGVDIAFLLPIIAMTFNQ
jgi:hypothetical protein